LSTIANNGGHGMSALPRFDVLRRRWAADWLERVGRELDLSDAQLEQARERYGSVGRWLADSTHPWLARSTIFVHGSIALGTGKRPLVGEEFDVDLIQWLVGASADVAPGVIKRLVGDRLRAHATYAGMLEEMPRCWRLNYANLFHLDITPAIPHPREPSPALYVPDRRQQCWKPSNPTGFRELFERRAALALPLFAPGGIRADVADFPLHNGPKGVLRRLVQLLKHHRDLAFRSSDRTHLRPISIIITTLAARAYEVVAAGATSYASDYDLLLAVVELMPQFIVVNQHDPARRYVIENETVPGENFAEKWNAEQELAWAFYAWHRNVVDALRAVADTEGQDEVARLTSREFGVGLGERVLKQLKAENSGRRVTGQLAVHGALGVVAKGVHASVPVRANTFFGR
jgi:hypothetical protein